MQMKQKRKRTYQLGKVSGSEGGLVGQAQVLKLSPWCWCWGCCCHAMQANVCMHALGAGVIAVMLCKCMCADSCARGGSRAWNTSNS